MSATKTLSAVVELALLKVEDLSKLLVNQVERYAPGHRFGRSKLKHMRALCQQAPFFAKLLNLDSDMQALLKLALRVHDLGRHLQPLAPIASADSNVHAHLGVALLDKYEVLTGLSDEQREAVRDSVLYHADKDLPSELGPLSLQLATLVQDIDRFENLSDPEFVSSQGIKEQIKLWYAHESRFFGVDVKCHPLFWNVLDYCIDATLTNLKPESDLLQQTIFPEVMAGVYKVIHGEVSSSAIKNVCDQKVLDADVCMESYASYMLFQCAHIFGIRQPELVEIARDSLGFRNRLDFISRVLTPDQLQSISNFFESTTGSAERGSARRNLVA